MIEKRKSLELKLQKLKNYKNLLFESQGVNVGDSCSSNEKETKEDQVNDDKNVGKSSYDKRADVTLESSNDSKELDNDDINELKRQLQALKKENKNLKMKEKKKLIWF